MASPLSSPSHHLLLPLLLWVHISSAQPNYRNITAGTTLSPLAKPTSWLSPSGDFAFGFVPHPANSSLFLLAVWFNLILPNDTTIVWCANGATLVPAASTATLKPNGQFSLVDPSGQEIWNPGTSKISRISILDTGNLVFSASDTTILWQSFDHPTDTVLPGQVLKQGTEVFARLMAADYTHGRFVLTMQDDGNLVMYLVAFPTTSHYVEAYWDTGTVAPGVRVVYNESGSIYLAYVNNTVVKTVISTAVSGEQYHRATLDPDGIFRQYTFPKNEQSSGNWIVKETLASNICSKLAVRSGSGACGFNSYCTMDGGGRVECKCAPNYSFIDPDRKYLGCKPKFAAQSCEPGGEASFDFEVVPNLDWPEADFEILTSISETECRSNCLKDCFCPAFVHSNGNCWKKKYPLSNGKSGTNVLATTLVKYSHNATAPSSSSGKNDRRTWTAVATLVPLGGSVILNLALLGSCFRRRINRTLQRTSSSVTGPSLCSFTYKELEEATKGFSEELGKGAFGTVYKGKLASEPRVLIAVKKLQSTIQMEAAEKDFTNETRTIGMTYHKNLVRLLGFCKEGTHRLLVYEFMSNGSLDKFLFGGDSPDWNQRIQIALGVGRGLEYLHDECRTQIIHCDIKPQNILVDDNLDARISDFGLAKVLRIEQTRTNTGIRGTIGYFAPEWFKNSAITTKVDVYSFGVVLLEIICCRKNLDFDFGYGSEVKPALTYCAQQCYQNGQVDLLVEDDEEAKKDALRLERFVMVAISCIQEDPALRPSMKKVVQMLEGTIEVVIPPIDHSLSM